MLRVIFWTLVAFGLAVFFGLYSLGSKGLTADNQMVLFGTVIAIVMTCFAGYAVYMLVYYWKRRTVTLVARHGLIKNWSRDTEPFSYWFIMLCYLSFFLVGAIAVYRAVAAVLHHLHYNN